MVQNIFIKKKDLILKSELDVIKKSRKTVIYMVIINIYWAPNHCIKMISEWSVDTENWSNDAENSDKIYYFKL